MPRETIEAMINERDHKTAAVIDLRKHEQLWEEFNDTLLANGCARAAKREASLG